jgi:Holliday junction resolvase RusA-like endonuclease
MNITPITYIIPGNPVSWKRAGHCNGSFFDSQKKNKLITSQYIQNQHVGGLYAGPLLFDITFYFPMPVSLKKKWDTMRGKEHYYRPDLDNLIKYYLDTCNKLLFEDDCLISEIHARKVYDDMGRVEFTIKEIKI